jgi:predicted transcriptional regulator
MAKKKAGGRKVQTTAEPAVRHARIELPDDDYQRLKRSADRFRLSVSAYIRQAVMERIERDEQRAGGVK